MPSLLIASLLALPFAAVAQERMDATGLVDQARLFFPTFEGDHKAFLTAQEEEDVSAAAHLLSAALALEPEQTYALWWKGHAETLLAENQKNRGRAARAEQHFGQALAALDRAIEVQPEHYWSHYARGMAHTNLGSPWEAIGAYSRAIELADEVLEQQPDEAVQLDARLVRFKARRWRTDARLRTLEFDRAREEFRSFYADNGNNQWNLAYSLAETHQRERDFAAARRIYEDLIEIEEYRAFEQTYSQLGYLAGLEGDLQSAATWLGRALENEFSPGFYPRLWMWILSPPQARGAAETELRDFVAHPPGDVAAWDLALGRYLLGETPTDAFRQQAIEEEGRRMREAVALDDLACEVAFYVGLREEWNAASLAGPTRSSALDTARRAYRESLGYCPNAFKWEWEFARNGLARLTPAPAAVERAVLEEELHGAGTARWIGGPAPDGRIERLSWHAPGAPASISATELGQVELQPGVLLQFVVWPPEDGPHVMRVVLAEP